MDSEKQSNYHSLENSIFSEYMLNNEFRTYRQAWHNNPRDFTVAAFPLNVDLEVTNDCNLNCYLCARTAKNWGDATIGYIDELIAKQVILEAANHGAYCIKFSLRGEPLLHPKLHQFLKFTKESGLIDFYFNTNGVLLQEPLIHEIISVKMPRISISVTGWNANSFSRFQGGAKIEVVMANIQKLRSLRKSADTDLPKIRLQAVSHPELEAHINEFIALWKPLADELGLVDFREETKNSEYNQPCSAFHCNFLWQRLAVLWDGSVYPCLFHGVHDPSSLLLGNVCQSNLRDMWLGTSMTTLRKLHQEGLSHQHPACATCSYRTSVIEKLRIKGM